MTAQAHTRDNIPTFRAIGRSLASREFWKRVATRALVALLVLTGLGYISDLVSSNLCMRDSRAFLSDAFAHSPGRPPLAWIPSNALVDSYLLHPYPPSAVVPPWRLRGALFGLSLYFPPEGTPAPWAYVRLGTHRYPFIVCVYYGLLVRDLYGVAGSHIYVTCFGLRFRLANWESWNS